MKKQLVIFGVCLIIITLSLGGCEELGIKPDYITVICQVQGSAYLLDENDNILPERPIGLLINMEVIKAGGENYVFQEAVNVWGLVGGHCTFKLYREQDIEAIVRVQGSFKDYYPLLPTQSKTLTWEQVKAVTDFGETYSWYPMFQVGLKNYSGL
jgi:hypothetical protein